MIYDHWPIQQSSVWTQEVKARIRKQVWNSENRVESRTILEVPVVNPRVSNISYAPDGVIYLFKKNPGKELEKMP